MLAYIRSDMNLVCLRNVLYLRSSIFLLNIRQHLKHDQASLIIVIVILNIHLLKSIQKRESCGQEVTQNIVVEERWFAV